MLRLKVSSHPSSISFIPAFSSFSLHQRHWLCLVTLRLKSGSFSSDSEGKKARLKSFLALFVLSPCPASLLSAHSYIPPSHAAAAKSPRLSTQSCHISLLPICLPRARIITVSEERDATVVFQGDLSAWLMAICCGWNTRAIKPGAPVNDFLSSLPTGEAFFFACFESFHWFLRFRKEVDMCGFRLDWVRLDQVSFSSLERREMWFWEAGRS